MKKLSVILLVALSIFGMSCSRATYKGEQLKNLNVVDNAKIPYLSTVEIVMADGHTIGSGTLIQNKAGLPLLVLTANHVTNEMESNGGIFIATTLNPSYWKMYIVKAYDGFDLSLISSFRKATKDGPYVRLSEDTTKIGEDVFAIGNPTGVTRVLTKGNISNIEKGWREVEDGTQQPILLYRVTAPIYKGNSGGGLFNEEGELLGVTVSGKLALGEIIRFDFEKWEFEIIPGVFSLFPEPGGFYCVSVEDIRAFLN